MATIMIYHVNQCINNDNEEVDDDDNDLNNGVLKGQAGLLYEEGQCDSGRSRFA